MNVELFPVYPGPGYVVETALRVSHVSCVPAAARNADGCTESSPPPASAPVSIESGLVSGVPGLAGSAVEGAAASTVALADVAAHPLNPRGPIDPAEVAELADFIRELGILEPVVLRPTRPWPRGPNSTTTRSRPLTLGRAGPGRPGPRRRPPRAL